MDLRVLLKALVRFWWLIIGVASASLIAAWLFLPDAPYEATVKASVIIAEDTDEPGNSERPAIMVLDDLLPLVESPAFAELVHRTLVASRGENLGVGDIQDALSGSRYSRILSVTVSHSSPERVKAISDAVNITLPVTVTTYLVAPGEAKPAIRIIDPGGIPKLQMLRRWIMIAVVVLFSVFSTVSIIWFREGRRISRMPLPFAQSDASSPSG